MEAVVDRIEKDMLILVLSDGATIEFSKKLMPEAKEGDVISLSINKEKTENRRKETEERINRLWKD